ncbi:MAG: MJ0042-type zinc finger domain-containing protein [Xanthobacteraceae bacterium]
MNIVCPHCATFFAIDPAKLGPAGRMVRCARCKEMWLARPEQSASAGPAVAVLASADATHDPDDHAAVEWNEPTASHTQPIEAPIIDSPSIAADLPNSHLDDISDDTSTPGSSRFASGPPPRKPWFKFWRRGGGGDRPHRARRPLLTLPIACVAMAALAAGLLMWRAEIVRLLPQTALFYRLIGLEVNLRGLAIKDVKVSTEMIDNKQVLVIEGNVVDVARKTVDLPRLRFAVRDAKGTEIYAWNAVLEQTSLKPGEKAWFRSRLAAPPPEGRHIDVRFFNRHDLAAGSM